MNFESTYFDCPSPDVYCLPAMLDQIEKQKERFFGSPAPTCKKYREPIRAVLYRARSRIRKYGGRKREAEA